MNETYEEYMHRKLLESVQYKPKEEPTTITLYADNKPIQVVDLKDLEHMSEEEYINRLKESWSKEIHYKDIEELTLSKYYNYEVEEEKPKEKTDWSEVTLVIFTYAIIIGTIVLVVLDVINGG